MADSQTLHVLIVGAGTCGLAVAHGLKKNGINFSIFEQEPSASHYRPREWSMGLHWSIDMLQELLPEDLVARFHEIQNNSFYVTPPDETLRMYDGTDGTVLKDIPTPGNLRVSRRKMRAFLAQQTDVQYGYDLDSITELPDGVELTFKNGKKVKGSIVVGTDGAYSKTRECIIGQGAEPESVKITHSGALFNYNDAEFARKLRALHPSYCMCLHPKGFNFIVLQDVGDDNDPLTWTFGVINSWLGERPSNLDLAGRWKLVKEFAKDFAYPFNEATLRIPETAPISFDRIGSWEPRPWNNLGGKQTLSGDAAHPMSPYRGQGLNHAMNSAYNFVQAMKKVKAGDQTLAEAVTAYEAEMIPRGVAEVQSSIENTYMLLDWNQFKESPLYSKGIVRAD